jgi:hypothetical protein
LGQELWWTTNFEVDKYGFSKKKKAVELYSKGQKKMGSIFQKGSREVMTVAKAEKCFPLSQRKAIYGQEW